MKRIIEFLQEDIKNNRLKNYGGLSVTVSLVDACAKIEYPNDDLVRRRYKNWLNKFYENIKPQKSPNNNDPQLTADEFYDIRNNLLHEAKIDERFKNGKRIIFTDMGVSIGEKFLGSITLIHVNRFIENVIYCIEQWMKTKNEDDYKLKLDINTEYEINGIRFSGGTDKGLFISKKS